MKRTPKLCILVYIHVYKYYTPEVSERIGDPLDKLSSSKRCASVIEHSK